MAYKAVVVSSLMLGAAQGHIFSSWSTQTATTANKIVEVPAAGGTRPVAAFGIATDNVSSSTVAVLHFRGEWRAKKEGGGRKGRRAAISCMRE